MTTRRNAITLAVSALLPAEVFAGGADERLAALIAEHRRFDDIIDAVHAAADKASVAERTGHGGASASVTALYRHAEALHREQGRLANAILNLPAASFVGVAHKLMLWRREAAIHFPNDFYEAHGSFVFSAYQDVLKLTGLIAFAHEHDAEAAERMRDYWI